MRSYLAAMAGLLIVLVCTVTFAADTAQPLLLEVVYGMTPEQIRQQYPDAGGFEYVLDRKSGALYQWADGTWSAIPATKGFRAINRLSGNVFCFDGTAWRVAGGTGLNVKDWGAKGNYDSSTRAGNDDTAAIQAALDAAGGAGYHVHAPGQMVYVPAGGYLVTAPLNMTTDMQTFRSSITVRGDGRSATVFWAGTGGVVFDTTGSLKLNFEDFTIYASHVARPSTVGFLFSRGEKSPWAINYNVTRVQVDVGSDPSANGGIGTVGIWNHGGEHHTYTDVWLSANLSLVLTRARQPEGLPAAIESSFVQSEQREYSVSQLMTTLNGNCVLIGYDYYRPALYINRLGVVHMDCTYISLRPSQQRIAPGKWRHAIDIYECSQFSHRGMLEGPGNYGYLKNHIDLDGAEVNVFLARMGDEFKNEPPVAPIELTAIGDHGSGIRNGINNSRIMIDVGPGGEPVRYPAAIKLLDGPFARTVGIRQSQIIMRPAQNGAFVTPNLKEIPGTTFSPTLTAPPIRNGN